MACYKWEVWGAEAKGEQGQENERKRKTGKVRIQPSASSAGETMRRERFGLYEEEKSRVEDELAKM